VRAVTPSRLGRCWPSWSYVFGSSEAQDLFRAIGRALLDGVPYGAVFAIYVMMWFTAAAPGVPEGWMADFSFMKVVQSIGLSVWRSGLNEPFMGIAPGEGFLWLLLGISFGVLSALIVGRVSGDQSPTSRTDLGIIGALAICIIAPTMIVEASFTSAYGFIAPGTRWAMVMQFWVPAVILFIGTLVGLGAKPGGWIMFVAVLCGLSFISLYQVPLIRTDGPSLVARAT
jgi:hypothetical protein